MIKQLGVWCEGSGLPGPRHNVAFPNFCRAPDGALLMVHRVGPVKNSPVGEMWVWKSTDEGRTFKRLVFDALNPEGAGADFRPAAMSDIGGGKLAMILTWIDHPDESPVLVNPATEGLLPIRIGWRVSADCGESWTPMKEIPVSPLVQPAGNCPILRLGDGSLLTAFETYKHFDDPSPWSANCAVVISRDDGRTWETVVVARDDAHQVSYYDPHVYEMDDGSLICLMWADDRRAPGASLIYRSRSGDGGGSWSAPEPTGIEGQFSAVIKRGDSWLMFYVVRSGDSAIRMALGSRDGSAWRTVAGADLYSQRASDLAAAAGGDYGDYLKNMGQWSFGWPAMVGLRDGGVLAAYYAGKGDGSSIYLAKVEG